MCLLASVYLLCRNVSLGPHPLFNQVVYVLLLSCKSLLYILDIISCWICTLQVFSQNPIDTVEFKNIREYYHRASFMALSLISMMKWKIYRKL